MCRYRCVLLLTFGTTWGIISITNIAFGDIIMGKQRKCIAVLIEKPNKDYQAGILKGIYKAAFSCDMNVAVFAVTMPRSSDNYHNGEMNIFTLPGDYSKFCGVIYLPDTVDFSTRDEIITKPLLRCTKEHNIPLVTIDYQIDGVPCFLSDDSDVVKAMVHHLIKVHGCRDIAYMTGIKGHPHAEHRLAAFRAAMREDGLEIQENRVFYGDFWTNEGENVVRSLIEGKNGLPEAIICANSFMTDSVYNALYSRGLHVPQDVRLASYGETTDDVSFVTSTIRRTDKIGCEACRGIIDIINGNDIPLTTQVKCDFGENYALTCGCAIADDYNLNKFKQDKSNSFSDFFSEFNTMSEALINSKNMREMFWTANWFTYSFENLSSINVCMCDDVVKPESSIDENSMRTSYSKEMLIVYSRRNFDDGTRDEFVGTDRRFDISEVFPPLFSAEGAPAAYVFRPLHFEQRCFGYAVISYGDKIIAPPDIYDFWINVLANAIESQRRLAIMSYLYGKMRNDAITDLMTGLLNRNGFNLMLPQLINEARAGGKQFLIVMADLNGLKYVNDTFGHSEGDTFIKTAAGAMARTWIGGAVCEKNFRIGGDEFVKAAYGDFSEDKLDEFRSALYEYLDNYNRTAGKPYPIYMPLGFCLCAADEVADADKMLSVADAKMYTDKLRLKKETGFDPKRKE